MKKVAFLSAAFLAIAVAAYAQTGTPDCAPVDGGLSLLLIAGAVGYGAKAVANKTKKKSENAGE